MLSSGNREALGKYMSSQEAQALGLFSGTEKGGYYMPPGEPLMAYYTGRVYQNRRFRGPAPKEVVILNRGPEWFIGIQAQQIGTSQMLESLHHGISNGRRAIHTVEGTKLVDLLRDPGRLPEIQLPRVSATERITKALTSMHIIARRLLSRQKTVAIFIP